MHAKSLIFISLNLTSFKNVLKLTCRKGSITQSRKELRKEDHINQNIIVYIHSTSLYPSRWWWRRKPHNASWTFHFFSVGLWPEHSNYQEIPSSVRILLKDWIVLAVVLRLMLCDLTLQSMVVKEARSQGLTPSCSLKIAVMMLLFTLPAASPRSCTPPDTELHREEQHCFRVNPLQV